jgi:hypothetical protein
MTANRQPRELEERKVAERPRQWSPAELLPEPDKQPGFVYRWVRVSINNSADPRNMSRSLREGYEPVKIEEQPKFQLLIDPTSRFSGNIEIGGLLLCKCPTEFVEQRAKYFADLTAQQAAAVDSNLMRQSDPRMPIFKENKSSASFGKGF